MQVSIHWIVNTGLGIRRPFPGHTLGHYISALALMSVNTGSQMLKHKLDTILHQLNYLQVKEVFDT